MARAAPGEARHWEERVRALEQRKRSDAFAAVQSSLSQAALESLKRPMVGANHLRSVRTSR